MRDKKTEIVLKSLLPTVDAMSSMDPRRTQNNETVLIDKRCMKRTYLRNGYNIILFQNPQDPQRNVLGSIALPKTTELDAKSCLDRAREDYTAMGAPFALTVLELHQKKYDWLQSDPDLGPAKWLDCMKNKSPEYYASLGTLVHELNHELSSNHCMVAALDQSQICINLPAGMPPTSLARISQFKAKGDHAKKISAIQDLYLFKLNQPISSLLDEMNAYALSSMIQAKVIETHGPLASVDPHDQSRYAELLPLLQLLCARYFIELKKQHPSFYERTMSRTGTRQSLQKLFQSGETVHNDWLEKMKRHNVALHDFEKDLWAQYLKLKPQIFPQPQK